MTEDAVLRVYRLEGGARFDGTLIGALERAGPGDGAVLDALLVARDLASGELQAIDLSVASADGTLAAMLDFRMDPGRRATLTRRTMSERAGGLPRSALEGIAASLGAGDAMLAVLHRGPGAALQDAVARCGGRLVAARPVRARALRDVTPSLLASVTRWHEGD